MIPAPATDIRRIITIKGQATEQPAARIRGGVAEATGVTVASVENYEVNVFKVSYRASERAPRPLEGHRSPQSPYHGGV